jgi:hypothetical protein
MHVTLAIFWLRTAAVPLNVLRIRDIYFALPHFPDYLLLRLVSAVCMGPSSSIGTTARYGLWPVEQYPSIFSCHQLSPSSHS